MPVDSFARQTAAKTADLTSTSFGKGGALVGHAAGLNGFTVPSTLAKFAATTIDVRTLGAVGDGTLHPLSEFYPTLSAAQAVYPFATALTQSVDWCAIQLAQLIAYNSASGCHPDIDLGFGSYVIDADIQCYAYAHMRGRGAGTSHSGPPTNGYLSRGYQTTLVAKAGYNGNMLLFNASSAPADALSDTIIQGICFRGNWTGPSDATNITGRAIYFNGVYMIQNSYIENCEFHNFAQDAVLCNVVPLPARFRRLWGRYIGGSVVRISYNAARGSHSLVFEDIQGDFIGSNGLVAADGATIFDTDGTTQLRSPLIMLDGSLRVGAAQNALSEGIIVRDVKHEINSWRTATNGQPNGPVESGGGIAVFGGQTVHAHHMRGVTLRVENVNVLPSNPYSFSGGLPTCDAVLLVTGSQCFYEVRNSRLGSSIAAVDYLVRDLARSNTFVSKNRRGYAYTRREEARYMPTAGDYVTRSGVHTDGGVSGETQDRFRQQAGGLMEWGAGAALPDTNLYREAADRLRTDDLFTAKKMLMRGTRDLVSGDFALTGWGTGASISITANSIDSRWRITITAGTTPAANPSARLTFSENVYPIAVFLHIQMGFGGTGAIANVVPESTSNPNPAISQCAFTYLGTPVAGSTYIFEGLVF